MRKLSLILLVLALILSVFPTAVLADTAEIIHSDSFDYNHETGAYNFSYTVDAAGLLTITGKGALEDNAFSSGRIPKPQGHSDWSTVDFTSVVVSDGVTALEDSALGWNPSIKNVTLGKDVASIGAYAFYFDAALEWINLPAGLTSIGQDAFDGCGSLTDVNFAGTKAQWMNISIASGNEPLSNAAIHCADGDLTFDLVYSISSDGVLSFAGTGHLTEKFSYNNEITHVVLGKGVLSVPQGVFKHCTKLQSIEVEPDNAHFCSIDGVLYTKDQKTLLAYPRGKAGAYSLPSTTESIHDDAFLGSAKLTSVTLNEGLKKVGRSAFEDCAALNSVSVSASVSNFNNSYVFENCPSLTAITVASGSEHYCSIDGVMFEYISGNKNLLNLLYYPSAKADSKYTLPEKVKRINSDAFTKCASLAEVTLNPNLDSLSLDSFVNCTALKTLNIPSELPYIDARAVSGCDALETVNYGGTVAQWLKLLDFNDPDNVNLILATVNCSDKTYTADGITFYIDGVSKKVSATLSRTGKLTVSGAGHWDTYPFDEFRDQIKQVEIKSGVTELGYGSFCKCNNLKKISLPKSIEAVKNYAFYKCYALDEISYAGTKAQWQALMDVSVADYGLDFLSDALSWVTVHCSDGDWFYGDFETMSYSMSDFDMILPAGITRIEKEAFTGVNVGMIYIPDGCKSIGSDAFADCDALSIYLPASVTSIAEDAFDENVCIMIDPDAPDCYAKTYALKNDFALTYLELLADN